MGIDWMTAEQNITFVLAARGVPREERKIRARTFLHHVQLDGFEDAMPHQLSGGMKMRLSLARALAVDAPVLQMNELLHRRWLERHKTIVFVTHDVNEAMLLGSRVVLMAKRPGRIIADLDLKLGLERDPEDLQLSTLAAEIRRKLKAGSDHAKSMTRWATPLLFMAVAVIGWELMSRIGPWPRYLFPGPQAVVEVLIGLWTDGRLLPAVGQSLGRLARGYALSVVFGLGLGIALAQMPTFRRGMRPIVQGLQALPSICWLPLALLGIDPLLLKVTRTYGISGWRRQFGVMLPAALPGIVTGLKLGWSFAWRALLAGELLYVSGGLGQLLTTGRELLAAEQVLAVMLAIIVCGIVIDRVIFRSTEVRIRRRWGLVEA